MKIFFDTTVFFNDFLLTGRYINILLDLSKNNFIELFISKIVIEELKKNYIEDVTNLIKKTNSNINKCRKFKIVEYDFIDEEIINPEKIIDERFKQLENDYNLKIVDYENNFLPSVLESYYKIKKPFSKGKDSFKDCLIWLSYEKIIKSNTMLYFAFISNNTSDFADASKSKLHPDLEISGLNIEYYKDLYELFNKSEKFKSIHESYRLKNDLLEWTKSENIDKKYVLKILNEDFKQEIEVFTDDISKQIDPYKYGDFTMDGYVQNSFIEINNIELDYIDVIENQLIISGELILECNIEIYGYNSYRDSGDEQYFLIQEGINLIKAEFYFFYNKDHIANAFDLKYIDFETDLNEENYEDFG
ncbi:MAG: hypothetical protein A2086_04295 [Spirochaetes bacterium GWD1_27_9]|nr:MAG: hypothetical protein A2Z98_06120 [Spirochaetes bacterium GWB1_27_13]OHD22400.1 MAG: hypothetical protein A2Y34_03480 [Spirochaetes bacterium GWC1_27_15]OHD41378.1 MAG: hypothetical protein A2086_04295 [Spirochaetes bacterium GWD1_27_9]